MKFPTSFPPPLLFHDPGRHHLLVTETSVVLALVIVAALGFDFTNGFHDTANAVATSIATRALRPKTAVALSGILNLIGEHAPGTKIVLVRKPSDVVQTVRSVLG